MKLMKQSNGKQSTTVTIMWISFVVSIVFVMLGMIDIDKEKWGFCFRAVDPSIILFLLGPSSALYGWRRYQDNREVQDTMDRFHK